MKKQISVLLVLCMFTILLSACKKEEKPVLEVPPALQQQEAWKYRFEDGEINLEEILASLTLKEKAAQMVQAERQAITPEQLKQHGIGSILSGGGSAPSPNLPDQWAKMYNEYQTAAMHSSSQIPILYGVDAVHGHNNVQNAVIFPHNINLGATRNKDLVLRVGTAIAKEVAATGVNWNFAPAVSVVGDIRWGRTYESFGETPELQELLAKPYTIGLQEENIVATAKHFIGDGGTTWDGTKEGYPIDQGDTRLTLEELKRIHLQGYLEALEAGVDTIMASFSSFNGIKMHAHKELLTDYLKDELGFEGFIISDWEGLHHLEGTLYDQVVASVNAGVDMLMEPYTWEEAMNHIVTAVEKGDISEERVNDAVMRILKVKHKHNLLREPLYTYTGANFGTEEHRELAREAVRESLVLLKNEGDILPLSKDQNILLLGEGSDNIGYQSGGWTIAWQGASGYITAGTSILSGMKAVLEDTGHTVYTDETLADKASAVVVVIGETPYAEGLGDNDELTLDSHTAMPNNRMYLEKAKETGLPMVVVILAGRPLLISEEIEGWDSVVMGWLPGSEAGKGISDVLFGDYDFSGVLPVTWPRSHDQIGITANDSDYDSEAVLFPYGFGLQYNK